MFSLSEKEQHRVPIRSRGLCERLGNFTVSKQGPRKTKRRKPLVRISGAQERAPARKKWLLAGELRYGVPAGAPAICHENARNDDAVRSMAGSTVEYDWTKSLYT